MAVALALVAAGCGGSDQGSSEPSTTGGGADVDVGSEPELPDILPGDFYLPEGMTVRSVVDDPDSQMISVSGTFESGDVEGIQADMVAGLQAAGYELLGSADDDIAAFVRNGVGRIRVRTSEFLGDLTLTIDIDTWTDEQLDELRALFAEEVTAPGRATADVGDESLEAAGECTLTGANRSFYAEDVSITIQIDETQDPVYVYADVTTPDGRVFTTDATAGPQYESSTDRLSATGEMTELYNEAAGTLPFSIAVTCDV